MERTLYDPAYEHDACGVGMIADLNGNKTHQLVSDAITMLENLKHRGAEGADEDPQVPVPLPFFDVLLKLLHTADPFPIILGSPPRRSGGP